MRNNKLNTKTKQAKSSEAVKVDLLVIRFLAGDMNENYTENDYMVNKVGRK